MIETKVKLNMKCLCVGSGGGSGQPAETVGGSHTQCPDSKEGQAGIASWMCTRLTLMLLLGHLDVFLWA